MDPAFSKASQKLTRSILRAAGEVRMTKTPITLEGRLLVTALLATLIWALAPQPKPISFAWIEPGTSFLEHKSAREPGGIRR